jgi:hypothetical protein
LATFQHPSSLNALKQFGQARAILRTTTRASNPAWYQEALELDFQLHLRTDGAGVVTFYYDRRNSQWTAGPSLTEESILDSAKVESLAAEVIRTARSSGANSLGVILHVADEFATTALKAEFDHTAALPELRAAATADPASILSDSLIDADQSAWRVLPYPATGGDAIATAITLTKHYSLLFDILRQAGEKENFPVITHALSAPLVAMMGFGELAPLTPGKAFVAILQYPWFTVLAFFNERADLRLIRTLQHRGLRRPTNFRNALATTNASLELIDPDLFIVPLGANVDATVEADLKLAFPISRVESLQQPETEGLPSWCPEPAMAGKPATTPMRNGITSHTFQMLREEKWTLQDFLPTPSDIAEIYPSRSEMRLLRTVRLARVAVFGMAAVCIAYFGWEAVQLTLRDEWKFDSTQAQAAQARLTKLNQEKLRLDHWNNLLEDRSKAWINMEALSQLFPEQGGMLVKTYTHTVKPDATPGKATAKVGFTKEWKINGFARGEAKDFLDTINTREGISAYFADIARITGNTAYSPNIGNRNLSVDVRTPENASFKADPQAGADRADESSYPYTLEVTITQRFEATDPMAIDVAKVP